ncbi:MAG: tyrosine-type recombinase/integrase [Thermoguttaceae bacterium]|nr:tyrosine-type recombinase/integrase [Thermoguttaceae bacterium]
MASLILKQTGKYQIKFYRDKNAHYLTLATGDKKQATTILNMVERLLTQYKTGEPDRYLTNWIAEMPADLRTRFEKAGLLAPLPKCHTFETVSAEYIESKKPTWKAVTFRRKMLEHTCLVGYFKGMELDTITKKEATAYLSYLVTEKKLAPMNVNKMLKHAQAVFDYAIDCEYTSKHNPFRKVSVPNIVKREKQYITADYTDQLIAAAKTPEWKTLIVLLRYAGMRPEEALLAEWSGVDFDKGLFTFRSPKTERHPGKDKRTIPLFPRVLGALRALCGDSRPEGGYILSGAQWARKRQYIASCGQAGILELKTIVKDAGLEPVSSLPTNMRGSCSTDLKNAFPEHVVDAWLGHSKEVANRHYDVITPANLQMAIMVDCFDTVNHAPISAPAHGCTAEFAGVFA